MSKTLREIEGTWEEIAVRESDLRGRRVRLTVLNNKAAPASSQGERGSYARILAGLWQLPVEADDTNEPWEM